MKTIRNLIGAALCAAFFINPTQAATNVWTQLAVGGNASGSWNVAANPPWSLAAIPGAGDTAHFGTLNITNSIVTIDANQSIDQLIFGDTVTSTAGTWIINSGGAGGNVLTLTGGSPIINVTNSTASLNLTVGGTSGFTKIGAGTLTLSPTNSFTGNVVVNAGILGIRFNDTASLLNPLGEIPASFVPDALTLNGAVLYNLSSAGLIQSMSITNNRGITIGANGATFRVNNGAQVMSIWGIITSDTGSLTKDGLGTLRVNPTSGLSTMNGKINVTAGNLSYGVNGSVLGANFGTFTADGVTLNNTVLENVGAQFENPGFVSYVNYSIPANRGVTLITAGTFNVESTSGGVTITVNSVITGSGQLRKSGLGQLTLNSPNTYSGGTVIWGGPGLAATGGALNLSDAASWGTGPVTFSNTNTLNGLRYSGTTGGGVAGNSIAFSATAALTNRWLVNANLTLNGVLSGGSATSAWTKDGVGDLTIAGVNPLLGITEIRDGKLFGVTGGSLSNSPILLEAYSASASVGVVVTDGIKRWTVPSLTCNGVSSTPWLEFNYLAPANTNVAPLNVTGAVSFSGTTLVKVSAALLPVSTGNGYPLMKWGSLSGTPPTTGELVLEPAGVVGTLSVVGNTLYLQITESPQPLRWIAGNNTWDLFGSPNWINSAAIPAVTPYSEGSAVQFEDTQNIGGGIITLDFPVNPAGVDVNSTNNYTFTGTVDSSIAGPAALNKSGSGTLTIEGSGGNAFTGGFNVNAGTVISGKPDGTPHGVIGNGNLNIASGATVIATTDNGLAGINTANGKSITVNTGGVLTNVGTTSTKLNRVVLNGGTIGASAPNPTFGSWALDFGVTTLGSGNASTIVGGNLALSQSGGTVFNILTGDTVTIAAPLAATTSSPDTGLTKQGAGTLVLNGNSSTAGPWTVTAGTLTLNGVNSGTGISTLNGGTVRIGNNYAFPTNSININNVTLASTDGSLRVITNTVIFNLASSTTTYGGTGNLLFTGLATLLSGTSGRTFTNSVDVEFAGPFMGANGGFVKRGAGTLTISGNATVAWAGGWNIGGGKFLVNGVLTSTNAVTVTNAATLGGNGVIVAAITIGPGSVLSPGTSLGTLTVTNSPSWTNGIVLMELNLASTPNSDRLLRTNGTFNYTGAILTATNLGPALTNGSTFTLFSSGGTGSFASMNLPPLGVGLGWTFNAGAGTLTVGPGVSTTPTNITFGVSGNQLTLSWPASHTGWTLQAQTNNTGLSTNWVNVPGTTTTNSYSITVDSTKPTVFYRLRYSL